MKYFVSLFAMLACVTAHATQDAPPLLAVGDAAPDFSVMDSNGNVQTLSQYKGKFVVLEWTNPNCPFVNKQYESGNMQKMQADYTARGVIWLSICSSAPGKEGNNTAERWNVILKERKAVPTALLLDPEGIVGRAYGAKTTPHFFIIDPSGKLVYQGGIDSIASPDPKDIPKAVNYVSTSLDELLAGTPVSKPVTRPYGCSVKY